MGRFNKSNLKKTIYYLKRNGIRNTWNAVWERMEEQKNAPYSFVPVSAAELEKQREWSADKTLCFSIIVPTYRTNEKFLREMIRSVAEQTYPHWELILADATEDDSVKKAVDKITHVIARGDNIVYFKLPENAGIAENTNQAMQRATGDYIGLLDHDDLLTADALYEMAVRIEEEKERGMELQMLYSDEDKCNGDGTVYYEPNRKEKLNLDLLLSNNYICHFLVMRTEMMKALEFRSEYDGAQDYDLVLRAVGRMEAEECAHIPKVLYHWRCHTGSTAENPQSKQYAYDAGLRALQDFSDQKGFGAIALPLKHLGFYTLQYQKSPFAVRSNLGAVGGRVLGRKGIFGKWRIVGGRMSADGELFYEGLPASYSGYLHRAILSQEAEALDIRCIQVREECRELFERIVGVPYTEVQQKPFFDVSTLPKNTDYRAVSLRLSKAIREEGYTMLYQPSLTKFVKESNGNE